MDANRLDWRLPGMDSTTDKANVPQQANQPTGEEVRIVPARWQYLHGSDEQNESKRYIIGTHDRMEERKITFRLEREPGNHGFLQHGGYYDAGAGDQSDED